MPYTMNKALLKRIEIEEIVRMVRLNLYNRSHHHGARAILQVMESMKICPLPSLMTIHRILQRLNLTHKRTGLYP